MLNDSISEEKKRLRAEFHKGTKCACCGQSVKLYKRKINSGMALFLIGLWRLECRHQETLPGMIGREFFSNKQVMNEMDLTASSLDYSVMKHFGIIEPRISEGGKKDSGYWRLTREGIDFVANGKKVNKHVLIFDNKKQGFSDEFTTIQEALGDKFDFQELMKETV